MFLILVDSNSKWLDIKIMSSITSPVTIEKLESICFFSVHYLQKTIVIDNSPSIISDEFERFCRVDGVQHITFTSCHSTTNDLAKDASE